MATLFGQPSECSNAGGRLIPINVGSSQPVQPLTLSLSYDGVQFDTKKIGVAVQVRANQQIAAQFQNALNNLIYVTPFGDKPGQIDISFISNRVCGDTWGSGYEVIQHYFDHRLMPDANKAPATVVVGSGTFSAYLVGLQFSAESSGMQLTRGTLTFRGWPK